KTFSRVDLEGLQVSESQLGDALTGKVAGENFRISRITAKQVEGALALAGALPGALARGAPRDALLAWEKGEERRFARYATTARIVLGLARRPAARRRALAFLGRHPRAFSTLVGAVVA
ncbi:MAG TPA: hypothetical protein VFP65_22690, partial [Anaeromyxobacteraceae bacterium]|nr:hypothetical protein [Anaeromyxobacteraceae bacterium]